MPLTCVQKQSQKHPSPGDFDVDRKVGVQLETSPDRREGPDQITLQQGIGIFGRARPKVVQWGHDQRQGAYGY
jgi:hypothetical protein